MLELYKKLSCRNNKITIFAVIIIMILGLLFMAFLPSKAQSAPSTQKILYWIDAMEPQIHYDGPGKSRMNMELIPVYAESDKHEQKGDTASITISPAIINNLGVRTAVVEEGLLSTTVKAFGVIKPDEDKIVHIHSYVEGWIQKLHVKKIQEFVEKDQPLFEIYSRDLRLAQKEYLILPKDRQYNDETAFGKLRSLGVSEKQIKELQKTKKDSPWVTIYAPQKGYIDNLTIREGMWVKPETTILSITDLSEVWVIAEVFPSRSASVKLGQEVKVFLPQAPNQTWQGKVDYIYPEIDPVSLTTKIRVRLQNTDAFFKPNMYVAVEIKLSPKNTLKIPKEAVIWGQGEQHVIIALGEGKFQPRKIVTRDEDDSFIEIISGLNKDEKVVTSAQFMLDSEISLKSGLERLDSSSVSSEHASVTDNIL